MAPNETIAIGLRAHSGWAALVALRRRADGVEVLARERVEMTGPRLPGAAQPYHAVEGLPLARARETLSRYEASARALAAEGLGRVLDRLAGQGRPTAACVLTSSGRPLGALETTLASHALIHTADGEHFRAALQEVLEGRGVAVSRVAEKVVAAELARALGVPEARAKDEVAALGRAAGRPWAADQKLAAAAAWVVLARRR